MNAGNGQNGQGEGTKAPPQTARAILEQVRAGQLDVASAQRQLEALTAQPLGFATVDHARRDRCGAAEVIFAAGKQPEQVVRIAQTIYEQEGHALITRLRPEHVKTVCRELADLPLTVGEQCGALLVGEVQPGAGAAIPIVTAGTSDQAVAEEAALTCRAMGHACTAMNDVGVAGLHRLARHLDDLRQANVIVCIAGMEGALPSVLGGLVDVPIIAVPTSVGYGAAFEGLTTLLSMLTSCAAGVAVVNIDNGFGAAYLACMINRLPMRPRQAAPRSE